MADEKAKGTAVEKARITELFHAGRAIEEIMAQFPHIDGRVISGIAAQFRRRGAPETGGDASLGMTTDPSAEAAAPEKPAEPRSSQIGEGLSTVPLQTAGMGLTPQYQEFVIVEKIDSPNAGIMKREMPPFGKVELLARYNPGEYKMEHYRDGRLLKIYREVISSQAKDLHRPGNPEVIREAPKPENPVDHFYRAMEVYDRLRGRTATEDATARAAEAQVKMEEVRGKNQLETVASSALLEVVKEVIKPKPLEKDHSVADMVTIMREERQSATTRLNDELTVLRERHKLDMEAERVRLEAREKEKDKDLEARLNREREHIAALQKIEAERQKLYDERNKEAQENLKNMRESLTAELDERREQNNQLMELQKKHTEEVIELRKQTAQADKDLKVAEIIKDGVVGGLDRIGARVDMLVEGGILKGTVPPKPVSAPAVVEGSARVVDKKPAAAAAEKSKEAPVLQQQDIAAMVNEPWFKDILREVLRDVQNRIEATEEALKPRGSMIGQLFVDKMNENPAYRIHFHYLRSRHWEEVLADIKANLNPKDVEVLSHPEAKAWFKELQKFLIVVWNASIGVQN